MIAPADEDLSCEVCKRDDDHASLMLCENSCNRAAHWKCLGMPNAPEGDWFCRDCKPNGSIRACTGSALSEIFKQKRYSHHDPCSIPPHKFALSQDLLLRCSGKSQPCTKIKATQIMKPNWMKWSHQAIAPAIISSGPNRGGILGGQPRSPSHLLEEKRSLARPGCAGPRE